MQRYKELVEVAQKYYPRDSGFCTVIALAVVTGWAFGKARSVMYRQHGRTDRRGSTVSKLNAEVAAQGFAVVQRDKTLYGKTLKTIQRDPKMKTGTFLIYTARHVTVMKDGVCEDWSNNEIRPTLYKIESVYEII